MRRVCSNGLVKRCKGKDIRGGVVWKCFRGFIFSSKKGKIRGRIIEIWVVNGDVLYRVSWYEKRWIYTLLRNPCWNLSSAWLDQGERGFVGQHSYPNNSLKSTFPHSSFLGNMHKNDINSLSVENCYFLFWWSWDTNRSHLHGDGISSSYCLSPSRHPPRASPPSPTPTPTPLASR